MSACSRPESIEAFLLPCLPMKTMRCIGLLVFCLNLGFVAPLAQASVNEMPTHGLVLAEVTTAPKKAPVAVKKSAPKKSAVRKAATAKKPAAKSRSRKESEVIATPVPAAKLDLTLPKDMVKGLKPPTQPANAAAEPSPLNTEAAQKPILPAFFSDKGNEDFQLNGRLLNNEMQLQRRSDGREVEGAALDFQFKQ